MLPVARISSPRNPWIKRLRAGLLRGELSETGECAVEGFHLVEEALRSGLEITAVVRTPAAEKYWRRIAPQLNGVTPCFLTSERVFRSLARTETSQGIAALVRWPRWREEEVLGIRSPLLAVLLGLQDPGNLGTLLRTLEAFAATACLLGPGTVNLLNAKAMRASAGSVFRVPHFRCPTEEDALALCRRYAVKTIALDPKGRQYLSDLDLSQGVAFLVGREGSGLTPAVLARVDETARIPISSAVDSLNAAVAAALALYETARQRNFRF